MCHWFIVAAFSGLTFISATCFKIQWMDEAATICAMRHNRNLVVTASVDDVYFLAPSTVGDRIIITASINRVFSSSLEVGVVVKNCNIAGEKNVINKAFFTMVSLGADGKVTAFPKLKIPSAPGNSACIVYLAS